jgi:hypothetical protein
MESENTETIQSLTKTEALPIGVWDDGSVDKSYVEGGKVNKLKSVLTAISLGALASISPNKEASAHNLDTQSYTTTTITEGVSDKVDGIKIFNNLKDAEIKYNNRERDLKFEGKTNFTFYTPSATGENSVFFQDKSKKQGVRFEIGRHGKRVALMPDEKLMDLPQDTIVQAAVIGRGVGIVILEKGTQVVVKKFLRDGNDVWDIEEIAA